VRIKIAAQRSKIGGCALAWNEAQLHQLTCCVVDENQQRAWLAAIFKPAVFAAVDLDQLAVTLATQAWLRQGSTLLARRPQPSLNHPFVQRLTRDFNPVPLNKTSAASVGPKSR
jgi:hypothetical protein